MIEVDIFPPVVTCVEHPPHPFELPGDTDGLSLDSRRPAPLTGRRAACSPDVDWVSAVRAGKRRDILAAVLAVETTRPRQWEFRESVGRV